MSKFESRLLIADEDTDSPRIIVTGDLTREMQIRLAELFTGRELESGHVVVMDKPLRRIDTDVLPPPEFGAGNRASRRAAAAQRRSRR